MDSWEELYQRAKAVQHDREVSPFIAGGQVAAAILSKQGNIYTGVCIDAPCSLGICAERNAIFNMFTNGEHQIDKLVCIVSDGSVGSPYGACRELLMELDKDSGEIEILMDYKHRTTVKLKELMPDWWGHKRFEQSL